jgi:hypothetical protein
LNAATSDDLSPTSLPSKTLELSFEGGDSSGCNLTDNQSKIQLGNVKINKIGASRIFTIKNSGNATLSSLSIRKAGKQTADFQIGKLSKTSIPAGGTATFTVNFKPKAKGIRNATIAISSNDADENPFDIILTGRGVLK